MKTKEVFFAFLGVVIGGFGAIFTLAILLNIISPEEEIDAWYWFGFFVLGILPLWAGITIFKWAKKMKSRRTDEENERTILHLARKKHGKLTNADIAMNTTLTLEEAKELMEHMCLKGFAEIEVSDSGTTVYRFHDVISDDEKRDAQEV